MGQLPRSGSRRRRLPHLSFYHHDADLVSSGSHVTWDALDTRMTFGPSGSPPMHGRATLVWVLVQSIRCHCFWLWTGAGAHGRRHTFTASDRIRSATARHSPMRRCGCSWAPPLQPWIGIRRNVLRCTAVYLFPPQLLRNFHLLIGTAVFLIGVSKHRHGQHTQYDDDRTLDARVITT